MLSAVAARSVPKRPTEPILREVSINDMLGPNPSTISSTTEYNKEYSVPVNTNDAAKAETGDIEARGFGVPYRCSFGDMCNCQPKRFKSIRWVTQSTSTIRGAVHRISEPLCPPGTIGKSFTFSYSFQLSLQAGPDIKGAVIPYLDKFGIRAGFSYTWGRAETSTYTVQCNDPTNNHPCVEIFTPDIGIISGVAYETVEVPGGKTVAGKETLVVPMYGQNKQKTKRWLAYHDKNNKALQWRFVESLYARLGQAAINFAGAFFPIIDLSVLKGLLGDYLHNFQSA
ncbi:hypothetical protein FZEAL_7153 [Fusarium zealandicum]|uniref:Uncharacterized protein n=1 Tax=Fusarium zealandicum TaxID=1053134 RepID=A0A8H4XIR1_9HYPO|nr:hypothetical protein FZEAL_7153 [Fusarium zealandicum]